MTRLKITARELSDGRTFTVAGRDAWALQELIRMGERGCTPIDNPGPRWSAYIYNLKREHGLDIETVHESHRGEFPGLHARYILRSQAEVLSQSAPPQTPDLLGLTSLSTGESLSIAIGRRWAGFWLRPVPTDSQPLNRLPGTLEWQESTIQPDEVAAPAAS